MNKLAINGGAPVRDTYLPYGQQWVDNDDIEEVVKVLKSDYLTTGGPKIEEFEENLLNVLVLNMRYLYRMVLLHFMPHALQQVLKKDMR